MELPQFSEVNWFHRRVWLALFFVLFLWEIYTLPLGQRDTLSETVRDTLRFTHWRFVFLPFWTWLTWHWILLGPDKLVTPTWRDVVAIGIGLLWASLETYLKYGTSPH